MIFHDFQDVDEGFQAPGAQHIFDQPHPVKVTKVLIWRVPYGSPDEFVPYQGSLQDLDVEQLRLSKIHSILCI